MTTYLVTPSGERLDVFRREASAVKRQLGVPLVGARNFVARNLLVEHAENWMLNSCLVDRHRTKEEDESVYIHSGWHILNALSWTHDPDSCTLNSRPRQNPHKNKPYRPKSTIIDYREARDFFRQLSDDEIAKIAASKRLEVHACIERRGAYDYPTKFTLMPDTSGLLVAAPEEKISEAINALASGGPKDISRALIALEHEMIDATRKDSTLLEIEARAHLDLQLSYIHGRKRYEILCLLGPDEGIDGLFALCLDKMGGTTEDFADRVVVLNYDEKANYSEFLIQSYTVDAWNALFDSLVATGDSKKLILPGAEKEVSVPHLGADIQVLLASIFPFAAPTHKFYGEEGPWLLRGNTGSSNEDPKFSAIIDRISSMLDDERPGMSLAEKKA